LGRRLDWFFSHNMLMFKHFSLNIKELTYDIHNDVVVIYEHYMISHFFNFSRVISRSQSYGHKTRTFQFFNQHKVKSEFCVPIRLNTWYYVIFICTFIQNKHFFVPRLRWKEIGWCCGKHIQLAQMKQRTKSQW
jgi:hypothetical protein